jgi:hypothetical protein
MAISEPRAMPTEGAASQKWKLSRDDFSWREAGGRSGGVGAGPPPMRMELSLGEMSLDAGNAWWGFKEWCRGAQRTFYAYDLLRPYPTAYPAGFTGMTRAGGGAFPANGAPSTWSVNTPRDVLTMTGMPAAFALAVGDWVGWVWSTTRRTASRVVEAGVADGSGNLVVTIEPPLPAYVPGGATMKLQQADMVMRLVPEETDLGEEDTVNLGGGKIVAEQDLRA